MIILNRFEAVFTVFTMLYYSSALYRILVDGLNSSGASSSSGADSNPMLLLMQLVILAVYFALSALRWRKFIPAAMKVPLCWALPLLATLSTQWSEVPDLSLRRGLLLVGATLVGVYWSIRYPLMTILRWIGWGFGFAAVGSVVFTLAFPAFGMGIDEHAGAWQGMFAQKNALSRAMILAFMTYFCLVLDRQRPRWLWWSGIAIAFALILLSTSKSGLLILGTVVACIPLFRALKTGSAPRALLWVLVALLTTSCISLVVIANAELIVAALGRDLTLTGRTGIWEVLSSKIAARPWLGYGYKGFWLDMDGESSDVWYATFFMSPNGHNGYLDLVLDLGLVGLGIFAVSFVLAVARCAVWLRVQSQPMVAVFPLLYMVYLTLSNITESSLILEPNYIFWLLYVTIVAMVQVQMPVPKRSRKLQPSLEESSYV
ncbi:MULTISPECIES: O-antigen ligase family protein [Leptolyngbya]|uniref:O-antigen ligase family protein n=1 Tax=Leptolyngbya TaxID=47251 RepID=UPI001686B704|nr:O-antigen ligase family protein [Leptolyngbya sp. FACHB-1624]MBD1857348.1 O-antigen ligase family protein [Leptolyngbya sp. FACHB-1624]